MREGGSLKAALRGEPALRNHSERCPAYSSREFHTSQQLVTGVDVFLLAKDSGTSSDMIERF